MEKKKDIKTQQTKRRTRMSVKPNKGAVKRQLTDSGNRGDTSKKNFGGNTEKEEFQIGSSDSPSHTKSEFTIQLEDTPCEIPKKQYPHTGTKDNDKAGMIEHNPGDSHRRSPMSRRPVILKRSAQSAAISFNKNKSRHVIHQSFAEGGYTVKK